MVRDYPIRHAEADGQHERFGTPNGSRPQVGQLACWPVPPPHSPPGQAGWGGPQADEAQGCRRAGRAERPRPGRATPRTLRAPVAPTSQRRAAGPSARTTSPGVLRSCDRLRPDSGWFGSWHTTPPSPMSTARRTGDPHPRLRVQLARWLRAQAIRRSRHSSPRCAASGASATLLCKCPAARHRDCRRGLRTRRSRIPPVIRIRRPENQQLAHALRCAMLRLFLSVVVQTHQRMHCSPNQSVTRSSVHGHRPKRGVVYLEHHTARRSTGTHDEHHRPAPLPLAKRPSSSHVWAGPLGCAPAKGAA